MEDHSRLLLAPCWLQDAATYLLHVHVLDAQPSTSTGVGTLAATERLRQYRAQKPEEGPLEQASRAACMRDYRAQRKEKRQYDLAKEAERKRQYRARKKLEAQVQQPAVVTAEDKLRKEAERKRQYRARKKLEAQAQQHAVVTAEDKHRKEAERKRQYRARKKLEAQVQQHAVVTAEDKLRKEAERKRQYRARKKLEAQLSAASSGLPPPRKQVDPAKESERKRKYYVRKKMEKLQQLAASGESPSEAVVVLKYRPRKKAETELVDGQNESPAGLSEKAEATQRKRQYRARNKLRAEQGFRAAPFLPMLKEWQANAETQCTRHLSASFTQAAIVSKTRTVGVQT